MSEALSSLGFAAQLHAHQEKVCLLLASHSCTEARASRQPLHVGCAGSSPNCETSQESEGQQQPRGVRHSSPFASAAGAMGPMAGGKRHLMGLGSGFPAAVGAGGASLHVLHACRACFAQLPAQWLCCASGRPVPYQQPVGLCWPGRMGVLCCPPENLQLGVGSLQVNAVAVHEVMRCSYAAGLAGLA